MLKRLGPICLLQQCMHAKACYPSMRSDLGHVRFCVICPEAQVGSREGWLPCWVDPQQHCLFRHRDGVWRSADAVPRSEQGRPLAYVAVNGHGEVALMELLRVLLQQVCLT